MFASHHIKDQGSLGTSIFSTTRAFAGDRRWGRFVLLSHDFRRIVVEMLSTCLVFLLMWSILLSFTLSTGSRCQQRGSEARFVFVKISACARPNELRKGFYGDVEGGRSLLDSCLMIAGFFEYTRTQLYVHLQRSEMIFAVESEGDDYGDFARTFPRGRWCQTLGPCYLEFTLTAPVLATKAIFIGFIQRFHDGTCSSHSREK